MSYATSTRNGAAAAAPSIPPKSVFGKAALILDQFTLEAPAHTLSDLVARTGLPKSSCHRLLGTLETHGFLTQADGAYRLGLRLLQLGLVAQHSAGLAQALDAVLRPLAERVAETVLVATLDGDDILYLHVIEAANPLRFVAGAGQRRDVRFGATGLALLACLTPAERRGYAVAPLPRFTTRTVTDSEAWLARLARVSADGVVFERGEYFDGITGVAVPIPGTRPATIAVAGPEARMEPKAATIMASLRATAPQIAGLLRL